MFKIFAILVLISIIIYTNVFDRKSQYTGKETTFTGIVYKKKIKEDKIMESNSNIKIEIKYEIISDSIFPFLS